MRVFRIVAGAAFIAALPLSVSGQELPFLPMRTVIERNTDHDVAVNEHVFTRCAALYVGFVAMLDDETDPQRIATKNQFIANNEKFQMAAVAMRMKGTTTVAIDAAKQVGTAMTRIAALYMQRINDAKARGQDMFADPLITDDFGICQGLLASAK